MKKALPYFLLTCFFMLVNQMAIAQVSNINPNQPNVFAKYYSTAQSQQTRGATDALVYIDFEIEDGQVLAALTNLGYTYVVATDWADFFSKLSYPTYKLAVMFNQGYSWSPDVTAVNNFIAVGGSMVYADWTHNASLSTLFQASFTGVDNQTEMTLSPTITTGLPNPITLTNTGWNFVFSTGITAAPGGEVLATFPNGDASIVRGNSGKTIILGYLSDVPPAAYRQQLFENLFISVTAPTINPTSISATVNPTCYGGGTQLTANGAVDTVYWYTGSCGGTPVSPATGNPITVYPTTTTTYYARNYDNGQYSAGCASVQITVEQNASAGSLTKNPNVASVCKGANVSATLLTGSGGNGTDETQYRTNDGISWSSWATYTPGSGISTTGKTGVEIQTRRLASYCSNSGYSTVSWGVYNTFSSGSIQVTGETICYSRNPAAIGDLTVASGGDETIMYQWQSSLDAAFMTPTDISSNTSTYDPPANLTETTWYRRQAKDGTCNTSWNTSNGVWKVTVKSLPIITGNANVKQGDVVTYSTPYRSGNNYTWNASHGNPEICFPNRNCLTLTWDFPCGIINPGHVTVTETDPVFGCIDTVTKWITITQ